MGKFTVIVLSVFVFFAFVLGAGAQTDEGEHFSPEVIECLIDAFGEERFHAIESGQSEPTVGEMSKVEQCFDSYYGLIPDFTPTPHSVASDEMPWLARLNSYRSTAGLVQPVRENPEWYDGCWKHSRYMVKNDVITHAEGSNEPYFSEEGEACGLSANVWGSSLYTTDSQAIDVWMQAPFHALGILDPYLFETEYAAYREADGGIEMAASLDVIRGRTSEAINTGYPVLWPGDGSSVPIGLHWSENPNPLTSCSGYTAPTGLPIIVQFGDGSGVPQVSSASLISDGVPLETCVFDESSYHNPSPSEQARGRAILDQRDAVIIIPRQPLEMGETYSVSLMANGETYEWSFSISASFRSGAPPPPPEPPLAACDNPDGCTLSVSWGDNDCSEVPPDAWDTLLILRVAAGLSYGMIGGCPPIGHEVWGANSVGRIWGDVDCSGSLNALDARLLLRFNAGVAIEHVPNCPRVGETVTVTFSSLGPTSGTYAASCGLGYPRNGGAIGSRADSGELVIYPDDRRILTCV